MAITQMNTKRAVRHLIVGLALGTSVPSWAAETDQYFSWGADIPDSIEELNKHYNQVIADAIDEVNERPDRELQKCEDVAAVISKKSVHTAHLIELIPGYVKDAQIHPGNPIEYFQFHTQSAYAIPDPLNIKLLATFTGSTLYTHGVSYGTDKPQHFFGMGFRYFQIYQEAKDRGASEEDAMIESIKAGIKTEYGAMGMGIGGVFSMGDLESNFQGSEFYRDLCTRKNPLLTQDPLTGKFTLQAPGFDWKRYLNPGWDESYNFSIFSAQRWNHMKKKLKKVCHKLSLPSVIEQREKYKNWPVEPSFSLKYLHQIPREGFLRWMDKHSIDEACK